MSDILASEVAKDVMVDAGRVHNKIESSLEAVVIFELQS
jgi:hypothetical protein